MKPRALTIILAIAVAVLATGGVAAYVNQANTRALAGMRAATALVAQSQIEAGTSASAAASEGLLKSERMPASSVPADAVTAISGGLGSLVFNSAVQPGQLLLRGLLVNRSQAATSGALAIPTGDIAVTVPVCLPGAVAGYLQPGSQVAVFDTYNPKGGSVAGNCGGGSAGATQLQDVATRLVLPRVEVLSISSAHGNGGVATRVSQGAVMVTVAVNQNDAERLIMLTEAGLPYLALTTPSSQVGFSATVPAVLQP